MRKGFTLIEVMISVMIISLVIGVLLQLYSNNTRLFGSMRSQSELCMRSSLLIGNTDYGYEDKKVTLAELVQSFNIDDDLRKELKTYKVQINYNKVQELDMKKEQLNEDAEFYIAENTQGLKENAMEIGRTSLKMQEYDTFFLRLKPQ